MRNKGRDRKTWLPIALLFSLVSCGASESPGKLVALPSGRQVKVLGVTRMQFSQGEPALMLKYETAHAISDVQALTAEADEIWLLFRSDVDRAGLNNAIVSATSKPTGTLVKSSASYNFVFQKRNGTWERLANK